MKYFLPLLLVGFALTSCAKKKAEEQAAEDEKIIQQYISNNNLTAIPTGPGLYYVIDSQGTGSSCTGTSTVRVAYTGSFTSGVEFEQSPSTGITFSLQSVIKGWTEGIPYFKEGGSGKLILPSALAYGKNGSGSIPPNTVLIFDIELLEVL
jgi:FKBP-type peptidyl-prolyl cis-trans isomerase FkpA